MRLHGLGDIDLASVPRECPKTYIMLQKADSIGTFQVESRAQIAMLPRMKPKELYDLVIQVAIVRPGPIQGGMVHPYLRRRNGEEKVVYPSPAPPHPKDELVGVLGKTLGVPLFQEQAMKLAITAAEFTPDQADGPSVISAQSTIIASCWWKAWFRAATSGTLPNAATNRSRVSANMASRKATHRRSPGSPISPHG
jgi:hypothetical protein